MSGVELTVGSSVSHGQDAGSSVLQSEVFILKFVAVDGLSSSTITPGEITSLAHEVRDNTVESTSLEVEGLARAARALLTGAESTEVLSGLGDNVSTKLHDDASSGGTANGHIKENARIAHVWKKRGVPEKSVARAQP